MDFRDWLDSTHQQKHHDTLVEHGFARVRRMLFGDVPNINMVGIITAHNPMTKNASAKDNALANHQLEDHLRNGNYGPIKGIGAYGGLENSFLVPHISRANLLELGKRYNQSTVIWGEKHLDENGNPFFQFEMIDCATGVAGEVRTIHVGNQDVQSRSDYFTKIKGRKFIIPFGDEDAYSSHVPGNKYGTIKLPKSNDGLKQVETFLIPFFDHPMCEIETYGQNREISYYSDLLPTGSYVKELLETIQKAENELLIEGKTGKWYWYNRLLMHSALKKLRDL